MMQQNNQVAIITGATKGIGRATAIKFLENSIKCVLVSRKNNLSFKYLLKKRFDKKLKQYLSSLGYLIVEKELNSGLNGFEIKDNIMFGATDKRRNGLVLYN